MTSFRFLVALAILLVLGAIFYAGLFSLATISVATLGLIALALSKTAERSDHAWLNVVA